MVMMNETYFLLQRPMWIIYSFIGAFGEVRMCVHRESGAQRAVKVLRKSHMDDDEKRMLFNEINILKEIVSAVFICSSKVL